jgi:osmotically-inducible protein OsmY
MRRSGPAADDAGVRSPNVDADDLHVSTDNGSVTLKDSVSSWAEHDEAIDAAWAAPGATSVHDHLTVAHRARRRTCSRRQASRGGS